MMMQRPTPKGVIDDLWQLLGVKIDGQHAVWQEYLPIRQIPQIPKGFVFLDQSLEKNQGISPFNKTEGVTSALRYMMFPFPGRVTEYVPMMGEKPENPLSVTTLLETFHRPSGIVLTRSITQGRRDDWNRAMIDEAEAQTLAVRIRGELPAPLAPELQEGETPVKPEPTNIDVILVADIDLLADSLFRLRQLGNEPGSGINLNFDNVTFVLNAIDSVAGDERFLAIRSRRVAHRTLSKFDENTDTIRKETREIQENLQRDFREKVESAEKALQDKKAQLQSELRSGAIGGGEAASKLSAAMMTAQKNLDSERERMQRELNIKLEKADVDLNEHISTIQGQYKLWSVVLPPIPPLAIAFAVFFVRRIRESEGIPISRRKK
jgi:ABC-2 type transport system permease protein